MKKTRLLVLLGTLLVLGLFLVGCEEGIENTPLGSITIRVTPSDSANHRYKITWLDQNDPNATLGELSGFDEDNDESTPATLLDTTWFTANEWGYTLDVLNIGTYTITVIEKTSVGDDTTEDTDERQGIVIAEGENPTLTFDFSI